MLDRESVIRAVELQDKSYRLLKWMADGITRGFIEFGTAHNYTSMPEAAEAWIGRHIHNIPPDARPTNEDLPAFSAMFCTYLENSFELIQNPGQRLYSSGAHCFCPMCSFLVNVPNLRTKKLTTAHKRRARKLQVDVLRAIEVEKDIILTDKAVDIIVNSQPLRETIGLVTYAHDLLGRMYGVSVGPAALVLWRSFAWTETGSPKQGFRLFAETILLEERRLYETAVRLAEVS